jgi:hypothetical protein
MWQAPPSEADRSAAKTGVQSRTETGCPELQLGGPGLAGPAVQRENGKGSVCPERERRTTALLAPLTIAPLAFEVDQFICLGALWLVACSGPGRQAGRQTDARSGSHPMRHVVEKGLRRSPPWFGTRIMPCRP